MIILAIHRGIDIPPSIYIRKWLRMMELLQTMPFLGKWFWGQGIKKKLQPGILASPRLS